MAMRFPLSVLMVGLVVIGCGVGVMLSGWAIPVSWTEYTPTSSRAVTRSVPLWPIGLVLSVMGVFLVGGGVVLLRSLRRSDRDE